MRRPLWLTTGLLAAVAGTQCATAADLPPQPVAAAPVAAPAYSDWTGFYLGIHGGGGWGQTSFNPSFVSPSPELLQFAPPGASPSGAVFGGQAGYNWQWARVVGGLEADFSWADLNASSTFTVPNGAFDGEFNGFKFTGAVKVDDLATLRVRLGYLIFPHLLLYGTAGGALGNSRLITTQVEPELVPVSATSTTTMFGWVAGAGLEWQLWHHWLLRGEWLHYGFGQYNDTAIPNFTFVSSGPVPPFATALNTRTTVDVARIALSYKF